MIIHLILTIVVLICFWIAKEVVVDAPIGNSSVKWGIQAIIAIICIVIIFDIWGISTYVR